MAAADLYHVVSQVPSTQIDAAGNIIAGIVVTFSIGDTPEQGQVFVPGAAPDPEQARERIRAYVEAHTAVAKLTD